jgi:hypothetical protein
MTVSVQQVSNTNTFDFWKNRTNELANAMSTVAVTTNSNTAVGNAAISGTFTANVLSVSNSTVNTSISVPSSAQKSSGEFYLNANGSWSQIITPIELGNVTTSGTSSQLLDSFSTSAYNGVEYFIHIKNNVANGFQVTKLLTVYDANNAYVTEYGMIYTNNSLGTFSANSNTSHVRVYVVPTSSNTSINFSKVNV